MSSLSLLTNDIILVIGGTVKHKFKNFLKIFKKFFSGGSPAVLCTLFYCLQKMAGIFMHKLTQPAAYSIDFSVYFA